MDRLSADGAAMEFRSEDGGVTVVFGRGCIDACLSVEVAKLVPSASGALVVGDVSFHSSSCEIHAVQRRDHVATGHVHCMIFSTSTGSQG